ncbi:M23 family metallopeptidase [Isoptericola variabilis]|uniref:M23 family metallopeptidase n=1 Tax=Isoptericola variabilis TaxID=139208 RepID=UPI0028F71147|nr:M23 family metallopeptidase [Isoptericola variabilis]
MGDRVAAGQPLGECGNSGNSTQPHVHVQAMDGPDPERARAVPITWRRYREWAHGVREPGEHDAGVPGERSVVEPA